MRVIQTATSNSKAPSGTGKSSARLTVDDFAPLKALGYISRIENQPILGVKRKVWRKDDEHAESTDAEFKKLRDTILQRDMRTCRFCGFASSKYQEVHHIDDDHTNNDQSNLLTVCTLCHQVHHLGMCAMRNGGFIAAIPELTQTEVNHIARFIFASTQIESKHADKLKSLYAVFQHRGTDTLKSVFGLDISNPYILASTLSSCPDDVYARRSELLSHLRLVPTKEAFHSGQLEYYAINNQPAFMLEECLAMSKQLKLIV